MDEIEDYRYYPAAGAFKAQVQNVIILLLVLAVSSVLVYYCTLLLLKTENRGNFYFAVAEIIFVLFVIGLIFKAAIKRVAYFLSPTDLLIQYGKHGYTIAYEDIKEVQILKREDFFDAELRAGGRSKLFRPYGILNEAQMFTAMNHLKYGSVVICATTKADDYLLLRMNEEQVPSLLISAENFNEFLNDLRPRLIKKTSIV